MSIYYDVVNFFKRNGGTILTGIASIGVVGTAYLTGKAAVKAEKKLEELGDEATAKEKVKALTPIYILPISAGAATIACMFGANTISRKQQASMLAAGALIEETYRKYKNKAEELLGDSVVDASNAKDDISRSPAEIKDDERLFYYNYYENGEYPEYGSYFTLTKLKVLNAEMELNRLFILRSRVTLNDFLRLLDLRPMEGGDEIGWSSELGTQYLGYSWIDFEHFDTTLDDGLECTIITTPFQPSILA